MYKTPLVLKRPDWSLQPLWRYLSFERLLSLLMTEELFFANLMSLSDGLEGTLTARTREHLLQWSFHRYGDWNRAQSEVATYEKHSAGFFVNCWHMNRSESYLMWKTYADRGCAIQTTFERIQAAFDETSMEVNGGVVDYIDFLREAPLAGNVFRHAVAKDLPYQDEREFRLIHWIPSYGEEFAERPPKGIRIKANLRTLIESIYVSPALKELPRDLSALVNSKNLDCDIRSSTVSTRTNNISQP